MVARLVKLLCVWGMFHVGTVDAQEARGRDANEQSVEDVVAVKPLDSALECLARGDLRCARQRLQEIAEHDQSAEAAYYLAVCERLGGDSVRSMELVDRIIGGRYGRIEPDRIDRLHALKKELENEVGQVQLRVDGPDKAQILLDGNFAGDVFPPKSLTLSVNPGKHSIFAEASSFSSKRLFVDVGSGESKRVVFDLEPVDTVPLRKKPAFWGIVGASIVAIGVGALVIYARTTESDPVTEGPFVLSEI